ncbi:MAG: DNA repair protein RadC [Candidatus Pacebacteria bacterium]|nr:DNA repair protein RadC [Candidatus Paceibacterota bacterium]
MSHREKQKHPLIKDFSEVVGHRKRLRHRFLQDGLDGFLDYEIIELLLTLGTPRRDCKQMAKQAIKRFSGLRQVLDASPEELQQIKNIGPENLFGLKLFQAISERYAKEKIPKKISLTSPKAVADYFRKKLGREKKEHFSILLLDSRNNLIKISDISVGTLNASLVHPREIFSEALKQNTASIILVHNHPSDDPEPSEDDLLITKRIVEAGKIMGIDILDHVIITKTHIFSFKEKGILKS